jgi:hypothetical protein
MKLYGLCLLCFSLLGGCAKAPDLEAPCRGFGQYCSQQPINDTPMAGV